jgi:putative transposase
MYYRFLKTMESMSFGEKTNYPKLIETIDFFQQKIDYIHHNPVRKEYVHSPEDWRWSSASKIPTKIITSSLEA